MSQGDLRGRVAIVTGSATGIGAATALGLARRGANIVVNYTKSESEANEVARAVRESGAEVRVVRGDVAGDEILSLHFQIPVLPSITKKPMKAMDGWVFVFS